MSIDLLSVQLFQKLAEIKGKPTTEFDSLRAALANESRRVASKPLAEVEATEVLKRFNDTLERAIEGICRRHSVQYWLNCLRRLRPSAFSLAGSPFGPGNVRHLCEIAILKYGSYEARDWREHRSTGADRRSSGFTYEVGRDDATALANIVELATFYYSFGRLYRRVGKGAVLRSPDSEHLEAVFEDPDTEALVTSYDSRVFQYGTFFGNLGISVQPDLRRFARRSDLVADWQRGKNLDLAFEEYVPGVFHEDPDRIPKSRLELSFGRDRHRLASANYLRIPVHAPGIAATFRLTEAFSYAFAEANGGLSPEEVHYCSWICDFAQTESIRSDPAIWSQFRMAGFTSFGIAPLAKALKAFAKALAPERIFREPAFLEHIRHDTDGMVEAFLSRFAFRPECASELSLSQPDEQFIVLLLRPDFAVLDLTHWLEFWIDATEFALEAAADTRRNRQFERAVEHQLADEAGVSRFLWRSGHKFFDEHGLQYAEVDAAPVVGDCLLWVECKTGRWSARETRGDWRAVRNRWSRIAHDWLGQADRAARQVAERGAWRGDELDASKIHWVVPVVCTSKVEYVADLGEQFWLTESIPRICTPGELLALVKTWNWDELKRKPFVIHL